MSLDSVVDSGLSENEVEELVERRANEKRRVEGKETNLDPVRQSLESSSVSEDGESVGVGVDDVIQEVDRLDDDLKSENEKVRMRCRRGRDLRNSQGVSTAARSARVELAEERVQLR